MHICVSIRTHTSIFGFVCAWIGGIGMCEHVYARVVTCVSARIHTRVWASECMYAGVHICVCAYESVAHQWRDLSEVFVWKDGGGRQFLTSLPWEATLLNTIGGGKHLQWILGTKYDLSRCNHGHLIFVLKSGCFKAILNSKKKKRPVLFSFLVSRTVLCPHPSSPPSPPLLKM